ncbi:MAG: CBS domain-containing protein [Bdellovibrionales bacterium]|nr:CBS domain-containing protein [Bdellovibrionales bacterium]
MLVRDIMTRDVFTLQDSDRLDLANNLMNMEMVRHIPVVDHNQNLVGLVTHRDLLKASVSVFSDLDADEREEFYHHIPIQSIMIKNVLTTTAETTIAEAAQIMDENKIGCLPVMRGQKLVGIITEADFLHLIAEQKPELCF